MKTAFTLIALSAALISGHAAAQGAPETIRGVLPANLTKMMRTTAPVQVATCPAPFREVFANQKLSCEKNFRQTSDVKCPTNFPNFTARNVTTGTDRDLCTKAGVNISSDGALTNFKVNTDYIFVPANGVRSGVSYVAADPDATAADGWEINTSNSNGITDRYQRTRTLKATPVLVNP
jgi:hypothetical protein